MDHRAVLLYIISLFLVILVPVHGSGTLELLMKYYNNTAGTRWTNVLCDGTDPIYAQCEPFFNFCLNHYLGNRNPDSCLYAQYLTGAYAQTDVVVFGPVIPDNIANPMIILLDHLQDQVQLKVEVWEVNDRGELLDLFYTFLSTSHTDPVQWTDALIYGTKPNNKSSLELSYSVYCDANWFGPKCDVFCTNSIVGGNNGNYICDQQTGDKICNPGWTDPSTNCTVDINECDSNPCIYVICLNKENRYRCVCYQGTNGTTCEENTDECLSNPCLNQGTCVDQLYGYMCVCSFNYSGEHCELDRPKNRPSPK